MRSRDDSPRIESRPVIVGQQVPALKHPSAASRPAGRAPRPGRGSAPAEQRRQCMPGTGGAMAVRPARCRRPTPPAGSRRSARSNDRTAHPPLPAGVRHRPPGPEHLGSLPGRARHVVLRRRLQSTAGASFRSRSGAAARTGARGPGRSATSRCRRRSRPAPVLFSVATVDRSTMCPHHFSPPPNCVVRRPGTYRRVSDLARVGRWRSSCASARPL